MYFKTVITAPSLVESVNKKNNKLQCRNSGNIIVECDGDENLIGTFQTAEITEARNWILKGKLKNFFVKIWGYKSIQTGF